jgi:hypothetical protein
LLSIRDECQNMIRLNCHPTYNERHQKIIEMIDWTLEKYRAAIATNIKNKNQQHEEAIIDTIIKELDKKSGYSSKQNEKSFVKR